MGKKDFSHIGVTKRQPKVHKRKTPATKKGSSKPGAKPGPSRVERRAKAAAAVAAATAASAAEKTKQQLQQPKQTKKVRKKRKLSTEGGEKTKESGEAVRNTKRSKSSSQTGGSNWAQLQQKLGLQPGRTKKKSGKPGTEAPGDSGLRHFKRGGTEEAEDDENRGSSQRGKAGGKKQRPAKIYKPTTTPFPVPRVKGEPTDILAIDCEMVGVGATGDTSALARVSVVNFRSEVVYDSFVRPPEKIKDFRTKYSGVTPETLRGARTFRKCQQEVANILEGRIVVGHALKNDFNALLLSHPKRLIRDTAHYRPLMTQRTKGGKFRPRALRKLAAEIFGEKGFQSDAGGHDSIDDAAMSLELYKLHRNAWEKDLSRLHQRMQKYKDKKQAAIQRRKEEKKRHAGRNPDFDEEEDEELALYNM